MDQLELDQYLQYYYLDGEADRAGEALSAFLGGTLLEDPRAVRSTTYFFARVAQLAPPVLRQYEAFLRETSPSGRAFILQVLAQAGDETTRRFLATLRRDPGFASEREEITRIIEAGAPARWDVLHQDIRDLDDLDLLWTEFAVSGSRVAILRVIQILEWPDRVRGRLEEWLRMKPLPNVLFFQPEARRKRAIDLLAKSMGIVCDGTSGEIKNREDLDALCFLDQLEPRSPAQIEQLKKTLPFSLTSEDLRHIRIRTAAASSLATNARLHERVREVCEEDLPLRSHRARLTLLEILGRAYLAVGDYRAAYEKLEAYCEANPANRDLRDKLRLTGADLRLEQLGRVIMDDVSPRRQRISPNDPDPQQTIAVTERATSYRSWLGLRDSAFEHLVESDFTIATWRFTYQRPDRFHVIQEVPWFWQEDSRYGNIDEWITIGDQHVQNLDGWTALAGDTQAKLNRFLTVDKYLAIMRRMVPRPLGVHVFGDEYNLLYEYLLPELPGFFSFGEIQHWFNRTEAGRRIPVSYAVPPGGTPLTYQDVQTRPAALRILIDPETAYLLKAQLVVIDDRDPRGARQVVLEQVFAGYGDDFHLDLPRERTAGTV